MKIGVVSVMRNEVDVIRPFLSHLAGLFDYAVLLDHGSVDGTEALIAAACQQMAGWTLWRVAIPGHHQAVFSALAMRHLFETTETDVVLFLDADEFIDVADRDALLVGLRQLEGERTAGLLTWIDCVPGQLDKAELRLDDAIWAHTSNGSFSKIVVSRRFYVATGGSLRPSSGNHTVEPGDGGTVAYHSIGCLLHIPLRSVAQLRQKIITGSLSVLAREDNGGHESSHWFDILKQLALEDVTPSDLLNIARYYGRLSSQWQSIEAVNPQDLGFSERTLDVARRKLVFPDHLEQPSTWRVIASVIRDWHADDGRDVELELDGTILRRAEIPPAAASKSAPDERGAEPDHAARVTMLELKLAEARSAESRAREETAIVRASTSYRITSPLRRLVSGFRLMRHVVFKRPS